MKNSVSYLFLIATMIWVLGCSGQPERSSAGSSNSGNSGSGESQLALGGSGGSPTTPTSNRNANANADVDNPSADGNQPAGDGDADDADESNVSAPPPPRPAKKQKKVVGRDRFGKPIYERPSLVGGGSAGGSTGDVENDTTTDEMVSDEDEGTTEEFDGDNSANNVVDNTPRANNNPPRDAEPEPKSFMELAQSEFAKKDEADGFQYLYAHALTNEDVLRNSGMDWYYGDADSKDKKPRFLEPRLALRWGIGIIYEVSGDFDGDPPAIGSSESDSSGGGAGGDLNSNAASGGQGTINAPNSRNRRFGTPNRGANPRGSTRDRSAKPPYEELIYYTGDYGRLFLERLDMRRTHDGGFYGSLLSQIDVDAVADEADDSPSAPARNQNAPGGSGDDDLGFVTGGGNNAGPNRSPGGNNRSRDTSADEDEDDGPKTSLQPGVTYVGVNDLDDLLSNAKKMGVDIIAVFEVDIKHSSRSTKTSNTTRLAFYSVKDGTMIKRGKALTQSGVEKERDRMRSSDDDPVELALDKVFKEYADETWRGTEFPKKMEKKHVESRIQTLLDSNPSNPLPVLVEIKQYYVMDFIDKIEMANAFAVLVGDQATEALIEGSESNQRKALAQWLPGSFNTGSSRGGSSNSDFR